MATDWIKLREGHEPLAVNRNEIVTLEGTSGGRDTLVGLSSGGSAKVQKTVDEIIALLDAAKDASNGKPHAPPRKDDDWLGTDTGHAPVQPGTTVTPRGPGRPAKAKAKVKGKRK